MVDLTRCGICGATLTPDRNPAFINDAGYCHPDWPDESGDFGLSCYEMAGWVMPAQLRAIAEMEDG